MKEINGTITLSYVEEDNRQRVIFRVIPLCTREGSTFHGGEEDFPDEGSLRIVPDKREQSTFKERMREIGGLCVVQLLSDGKELMKVRQNRNYAPDQGEQNQFAIYSDVICEFAEDGCFEVVEVGSAAGDALTPRVLLHKNKLLYGPVNREEAEKTAVEELKPFGNDRFLLHTIETPALGRHLIYWNPEATLNWRQRRNTLRRRDRSGAEDGEENASGPEMEETAPKAQPLRAQPEDAAQPDAQKNIQMAGKQGRMRVDPHTRRVERAAEILKQEEAEKEQKQEDQEETALPIGTRLDILDSELPFEQQISRLAQPLSESANRLTDALAQPEEDPPEAVAHFSGTPLVQSAGRIARSAARPEPMHHVVEQQMRRQRNEVLGAEMGTGTYGMIENPIENLRESLEYVWQNVDMREQAISMLLQNERFVADMTAAFCREGMNLQASAAAQEQLAEIEAERLSLLMQLESAKTNERKYREAAIASAAQKKRDEIERLKRDIKELEATKRKLGDAAQVLSMGTAEQVTDFLAARMNCLSGAGEQRVLLSPVLGKNYAQQELAEKLRMHMNESGFSLNEDEAMSLLINFSLYDAVCFRAKTIPDAQLFAAVLLESFGLQSVSATVCPGAYVEMISLLPEDARRTPTVTVQPLGTETMSVFGHKTLFLTDERTVPTELDMVLPYPVVNVPAMLMRAFGHAVEWETVTPAALSSFSGIRADSHPMLEEAERWFGELKRALSQAEVVMPEAMLLSMRRFIEVASRKVRGGFLAAADTAVCHWVVPLLLLRKGDADKLSNVLAGLPHTLDLLGIR